MENGKKDSLRETATASSQMVLTMREILVKEMRRTKMAILSYQMVHLIEDKSKILLLRDKANCVTTSAIKKPTPIREVGGTASPMAMGLNSMEMEANMLASLRAGSSSVSMVLRVLSKSKNSSRGTVG